VDEAANIRVRPVRLEDVDSLVALVDALALQQGEPREHFTPAVARRDFFEAPCAEAWLAVEDAATGERAIGLAVVSAGAYEPYYAARGSYLSALFVVPEARGRGVGRALVGAACAAAKRRGETYLWWVSKAWNKPAQAAYAKLGAVDDGVRAHAVFGEPFERLIAAAEARSASEA
jgi:GNAT superfamily N-acetyltransferase